MAVRKDLQAESVSSEPTMRASWWFDVMHQGKRWRMPPNASGNRSLMGEILAGRDPRWRHASRRIGEAE